ncbi:MAG: recombination protein RecR [Planctomycetota bacterium]|nr:MAG: recombination protein RecR [Planctomycetota bacterium]
MYGEAVERLIREFKRLPGIGQRTAERLTFHIVQGSEREGLALADAIRAVKEKARPCAECFTVSERSPCEICSDPRRDPRVLCVVERPTDVLAMEKSGGYKGRYHVLLGAVNLLEGVEPHDLTIDALAERVRQDDRIEEVILATNPTFDGDATALHLRAALEPLGVRMTRLARGLPAGGSLEFASKAILAEALEGRRDYQERRRPS